MANALRPLRIWRERMWWMPPPLANEYRWAAEYDDPATSIHPVHVCIKRDWTKEQIERWCEKFGYEPIFESATADARVVTTGS